MRMYVSLANAGQIVEVSYGWNCGALYRRTYDQSDRSTQWHVADEESARQLAEAKWEAWYGDPAVATWTQLDTNVSQEA